MIKLFVTDIDNTLYDRHVGIPQANIDALIKLQKSGVKVALASGRMAQAMVSSSEALLLKQFGGYIIGSNGAYVEALNPHEIYRKSTFTPQQIQKFALSAVFHGAHFTVDQGNVLFYTHHDQSYQWMKALKILDLKRIKDVRSQLNEAATRCSVSVDQNAHVLSIDAFVRAHQHEASFERLHPSYLDMMPLGNSKWVGLEALMQRLDFQVDEVAAIGDGENDRSMLARVGLSASLTNASLDIQNMCDVVVARADQAGVAQFAELILARNALEV